MYVNILFTGCVKSLLQYQKLIYKEQMMIKKYGLQKRDQVEIGFF